MIALAICILWLLKLCFHKAKGFITFLKFFKKFQGYVYCLIFNFQGSLLSPRQRLRYSIIVLYLSQVFFWFFWFFNFRYLLYLFIFSYLFISILFYYLIFLTKNATLIFKKIGSLFFNRRIIVWKKVEVRRKLVHLNKLS